MILAPMAFVAAVAWIGRIGSPRGSREAGLGFRTGTPHLLDSDSSIRTLLDALRLYPCHGTRPLPSNSRTGKRNSVMRYGKSCSVILLAAAMLAAFGHAARADIFQWQFIDPSNPSAGMEGSTTLCPGGAGATAGPDASLQYLDLTQAYLQGANLTNAVLYYTDLSNADLLNANLSDADLYRATLNANLTNANLAGAYLSYSTLNYANLTNASLYFSVE